MGCSPLFSCQRLVVEEWLELKFLEASSGQQVVSCIQTLRNTWSSMLEAKLESSMSEGGREGGREGKLKDGKRVG